MEVEVERRRACGWQSTDVMSLDGVDVQDVRSSELTIAFGLSQSRRVSCIRAGDGERRREVKDESRPRWMEKDEWKCLSRSWL